MFNVKNIYKQAKSKNKTIIFPEAEFSQRIVDAVKIIDKKGIANCLLVGDASAMVLRDKSLEKFEIVCPKSYKNRDKLVKILYEKRKDKGMTIEEAEKLIDDPFYFATLMVEAGYADGMVGGAEVPTARNIRPTLQIIKAKKGTIVSSCFLLYGKNKFLKDKTLIVSDAGVCQNPTSEQLCMIANDTVNSYKAFGLKNPKLAFLSYSTKGSANAPEVDKVRIAYELYRSKKNACPCDGELQFDAAMIPTVCELKAKGSEVAGDANILIFPNLEVGNICYKTMQYIGGLNAIGPILQGLKKPVNDLSRGCSVKDIVTLTAITVIQCEDKK